MNVEGVEKHKKEELNFVSPFLKNTLIALHKVVLYQNIKLTLIKQV